MIELFADVLFAVEAIEQNRVGFHFRVREFDCNRAAVTFVGAAVNRGHAAAGDQALDAVMIEKIAGMEFAHGMGWAAASKTATANLRQYSL
jgi:hypothetical protein